jgi:nitrate/TMAO reductase-like tetraheme cytochrome c subunit
MPGEPEPTRYSRFGRLGEFAGRVVRPPRSGRGFVAALVVVGGLGTLVAIGGLVSQQWTETAGFCSQCHTMTPEMKAYKLSPHRDVACGECHVAPGLGGLIKAKLNGAKQTLEVLAGTYPEPIRPPDHDELPSPKDTCMKCHSLSEIASEGNPAKLILKPRYREDRANTRETVAVMVRPAGLSDGRGIGAHWHVQQKVEFTSPNEDSQKIDLVRVTYRNGRTVQFISRKQVGVSSDVRPDIGRLTRTEATRPMDCITCHNRIGHEIPTPSQALDSSLAGGKISQSLPYIKREGVARIGESYKSTGEADRAIEGIRGTYAAKYPLVARTQRRNIDRAVDQLKLLYELVATPEMKAVAADYPNNLGHESGPGCFRCHDGAHFEVGPRGRLLNKVIPWACTTCHTFPQVGRTVSSVSVLGEPPDHRSKLWVFNHKYQASGLEPAANSSFCANCHSSGAAKVNHDEMLYRHPEAIAKAGLRACAYCHQEVFCARCHKKPVLEPGKPYVHSKTDLFRGSRRE